MTLSLATTQDIPELKKLVNSAYRGEASQQGWTTEADLFEGERIDETGLQRMMLHPDAEMWKCTMDHELAGCVYLRKEGEALYLGMLSVSPLLQGEGIGKKLLYAAEDIAKKKGCSKIWMSVITARTELLQWYYRHGYIDTGKRKPYVADQLSTAKTAIEFAVLQKTI